MSISSESRMYSPSFLPSSGRIGSAAIDNSSGQNKNTNDLSLLQDRSPLEDGDKRHRQFTSWTSGCNRFQGLLVSWAIHTDRRNNHAFGWCVYSLIGRSPAVLRNFLTPIRQYVQIPLAHSDTEWYPLELLYFKIINGSLIQLTHPFPFWNWSFLWLKCLKSCPMSFGIMVSDTLI